MAQPTIDDLEDLLSRISGLIQAADRGGVDRAVLDYLRSCRDRARRMGETAADDRRIPVRLPEYGRARLVTRDEAYEVELVDHSAQGFGIRSPVAVAEGDYARLDMEHGLRSDIYECVITYSHPESGGYRVGLEVFSYLRIGGEEEGGSDA